MRRVGRAMPATFHGAVRLAAALLLDDVLHRVGGCDTDASIALDELPPLFRPRIEGDLHRWAVAFAAAGSKLEDAKPVAPSCVAEQLAMHAILSFAVALLSDGPAFGLPERVDEDRAEEWMQGVLDGLFDDMDYLFLYDPALDGIGADPDEPLGRELGTVNLGYDDWFEPLPGRFGHPYFERAEPDAEDDILSSM